MFVAATYSFESFYQAIRRFWRFGQEREVHCYMVSATTESHVLDVLESKRREFAKMRDQMISAARKLTREDHERSIRYTGNKQPKLPDWLR